jgi:hypothetical protein
MNKRKFDIGERVFHCTKESPEGVVLNALYDLYNDNWRYIVTFGPETPSLEYDEHELSTSKVF